MLAVAEPDNVEQQFFFFRLLDNAVILRPATAQGLRPDGTATHDHQHAPYDPPHELRTNAAVHSFSSPVSSCSPYLYTWLVDAHMRQRRTAHLRWCASHVSSRDTRS